MNKIELTGVIASIKHFNNDTTHFTIATRSRSKAKDTDFVPCVCFGSTKTFFDTWFKVGKWIEAEGHIDVSEYVKDGQRAKSIQIVINDIGFVGKKQEETNFDITEDWLRDLDKDESFPLN